MLVSETAAKIAQEEKDILFLSNNIRQKRQYIDNKFKIINCRSFMSSEL